MTGSATYRLAICFVRIVFRVFMRCLQPDCNPNPRAAMALNESP